jgi:hypothetical protein
MWPKLIPFPFRVFSAQEDSFCVEFEPRDGLSGLVLTVSRFPD